MKIICVDNSWPFLTIGKEYEAMVETDSGYVLVYDKINIWYPKKIIHHNRRIS